MSDLVSASPPPELDIVHRVVDGILVVAVAGEVDADTAPALQDAVVAAIDQTAGEHCILDLTAVTFLASPGLTALVEAAAHAEARREPLRIVVDANRPVIRPIEITGLDHVLRLYHTMDEALGAGTRTGHPNPASEQTPQPESHRRDG